LREAYLTRAYLTGADLRGADLREAYLTGADLRGADLREAYLTRAYLTGAYLTGADNVKIEIDSAIFITGLYEYICAGIIDKEKRKWIKLGCYTRLCSDWENNFWNNPNEFTNDNSLKSNLRKLAFETCKKWFELNE
jgi:uncharacterized protein YjbI with pentapeptide repeats